MLRLLTLVLVWLALASGAGCRSAQPERVDFSDTPRNFLPSEYGTVYERWTRHARVVSEQGTIIEVWATLKSWEFREAYIERYAEIYRLSSEDQQALRRAQLEASRRGYEFHVSVQTSKSSWNDLERRSTPWRISLVDGAGEKIEDPEVSDANLPELYEMSFFPSRTAFSRSYTVSFLEPEEGSSGFTGPKSGQIALRITGPLGEAELVWQSK